MDTPKKEMPIYNIDDNKLADEMLGTERNECFSIYFSRDLVNSTLNADTAVSCDTPVKT